jgi:hypothetical protein
MNLQNYFQREISHYISNQVFENVSFTVVIKTKNAPCTIIEHGKELTIFITTHNNTVQDCSFELSDDFLTNALQPLNKECALRGLDFSTEKMRLEIIDDFKSIAISNFNTENVLAFVKSIVFFQYLCKYTVYNMKLPEKIWFSQHDEFHKLSPEFKITPLLAGVFDAFCDEIVAIPRALLSLYNVYFDATYAEKISAIYETSKAYQNLLIAKETTFPNLELRIHDSVRTVISVSFLMNGDDITSVFNQDYCCPVNFF